MSDAPVRVNGVLVEQTEVCESTFADDNTDAKEGGALILPLAARPSGTVRRFLCVRPAEGPCDCVLLMLLELAALVDVLDVTVDSDTAVRTGLISCSDFGRAAGVVVRLPLMLSERTAASRPSMAVIVCVEVFCRGVKTR